MMTNRCQWWRWLNMVNDGEWQASWSLTGCPYSWDNGANKMGTNCVGYFYGGFSPRNQAARCARRCLGRDPIYIPMSMWCWCLILILGLSCKNHPSWYSMAVPSLPSGRCTSQWLGPVVLYSHTSHNQAPQIHSRWGRQHSVDSGITRFDGPKDHWHQARVWSSHPMCNH